MHHHFMTIAAHQTTSRYKSVTLRLVRSGLVCDPSSVSHSRCRRAYVPPQEVSRVGHTCFPGRIHSVTTGVMGLPVAKRDEGPLGCWRRGGARHQGLYEGYLRQFVLRLTAPAVPTVRGLPEQPFPTKCNAYMPARAVRRLINLVMSVSGPIAGVHHERRSAVEAS
jgi:hypothetical protein